MCSSTVDEFQNFVTDSFATILSEPRKHRTIRRNFSSQLSDLSPAI